MNKHIFREYDIRGIVGADLNEETVYRLALAIGTYFRRNGARRISLGRDARESGGLFRDLMIRGLNETGCHVLDFGKIPTPLVYFSLFTQAVDGGVMITGSHNPANYNGFKLCLGKSTLYGSQIQEIKQIALTGNFEAGNGAAEEKNIIPNYLKFVAENINFGARKLKVVVDAGNGIGGIIGAPLYKQLGCEVIELFIEPDSAFPNHHPDPTVAENLQDAVKTVFQEKADLAVCFDGDGDRIGVVDERRNIIWGDELMMIFARSILEKTPDAAFIAEVKCSARLFNDIERRGGRAIMWKAGHSLIKAKMRETGAALAGEMSGHIFFADRYFGYDDAIYSGARLLEILSNSDKPLSEFLSDLPHIINTPEIRVDCPEEKKFEVVRRLTDEFKKTNRVIDVDGARIIFENGWGLVRASNTQAILVLRFEAANETALRQIRETVENKLQEITNEITNEI